MVKVTCVICSKEFEAIRRSKLCCSKKCEKERRNSYMRNYMRKYRKENSEHVSLYMKQYYGKNPDKYDLHRFRSNKYAAKIRAEKQYYQYRRDINNADLVFCSFCGHEFEAYRYKSSKCPNCLVILKFQSCLDVNLHKVESKHKKTFWKYYDKVFCHVCSTLFTPSSNKRCPNCNTKYKLGWKPKNKNYKKFQIQYDTPEFFINRGLIKTIYNNKCSRCNRKADIVHHIIPIEYGGDHYIQNLTPLCESCHRKVHYNINKKGMNFYKALREV